MGIPLCIGLLDRSFDSTHRLPICSILDSSWLLPLLCCCLNSLRNVVYHTHVCGQQDATPVHCWSQKRATAVTFVLSSYVCVCYGTPNPCSQINTIKCVNLIRCC